MSDSRPKVGERWRVTIEGEIGAVHGELLRINAHGCLWIDPLNGTWERIPDPEPEYPVRSVWIDAEGVVYERSADFPLGETPGWWTFGYPASRAFDVPVRPLTRLVPEVKP